MGLELNISALEDARSRGLDVSSERIEVHAESHQNYYDIVCAFQVLEHIPNVTEFIHSSLAALKTGGLLIFCIPNDESFIIQENTLVTNMPPHHMGLWTLNALLGLQNFFGVKTEFLQFEPLQPYHYGYGTDLLMNRFASLRLTFIQRALAKLARIFSNPFPTLQQMAELSTSAFSSYLPGHSILVVYRKVEQ